MARQKHPSNEVDVLTNRQHLSTPSSHAHLRPKEVVPTTPEPNATLANQQKQASSGLCLITSRLELKLRPGIEFAAFNMVTVMGCGTEPLYEGEYTVIGNGA